MAGDQDPAIFFARCGLRTGIIPLRVLRYGEDVGVGIFEPRDFVAGRRCPDSEFLILDEGIFFERDAAFREPFCDRYDVADLPA